MPEEELRNLISLRINCRPHRQFSPIGYHINSILEPLSTKNFLEQELMRITRPSPVAITCVSFESFIVPGSEKIFQIIPLYSLVTPPMLTRPIFPQKAPLSLILRKPGESQFINFFPCILIKLWE
eukprot:TRINITY_DN16186_c3_g1_i1.p1 TRINITY_DN16186_c3_g1~~TRINITY_DN16186_c3_g1_i1.p1  ORF type:complete len:125 (-),score=5.92 TRINITY_DN16186_c3_g1_i1:410-784(-)